MIPRRILWLSDAIIITTAFFLARPLVPTIQRLLLLPTGFYTAWIESVFSPAQSGGALPSQLEMSWVLVVLVLATVLTVEVTTGYQNPRRQSILGIILVSAGAPLIGLSLVALVMYIFRTPPWSRLFAVSFALLSGMGMLLIRLGLRRYVNWRYNAGYYVKNVVFVGSLAAVGQVARHFNENVPRQEYHLLGYLEAAAGSRGGPSRAKRPQRNSRAVEGLERLGAADELGGMLIKRPIDEVVTILPNRQGGWLAQVIKDCDSIGTTLRIVPEDLLDAGLLNLTVPSSRAPTYLPGVVLKRRHLDEEALFVKRIMDILISGALLLILSPLLGFIALAIKLTNRDLPVLYRWEVIGQNGAEFTGYKFTTMIADADERKASLEAYNIMQGPVFKMDGDPRVTPLGRFLRKFSLNELPQLWSVLKGDMSLVGPRPAFRHELERYEFWQRRKLSVRPGITCLWQVRGRNRIRSFDEWVRMDLEYIDNWSLWLDFKIMVRTLWVVLSGSGS